MFLPGESPRTEEPGELQSVGSESQTQLVTKHTHIQIRSSQLCDDLGDHLRLMQPSASFAVAPVHHNTLGEKVLSELSH